MPFISRLSRSAVSSETSSFIGTRNAAYLSVTDAAERKSSSVIMLR